MTNKIIITGLLLLTLSPGLPALAEEEAKDVDARRRLLELLKNRGKAEEEKKPAEESKEIPAPAPVSRPVEGDKPLPVPEAQRSLEPQAKPQVKPPAKPDAKLPGFSEVSPTPAPKAVPDAKPSQQPKPAPRVITLPPAPPVVTPQVDPKPAPTPAPEPPSNPQSTIRNPQSSQAPSTRSYTIQSGDTFSGIAREIYGDEQHWIAIAKANPLVDPARLKVGQIIRLPDLSEASASREKELDEVHRQVTGGGKDKTVLVEPGDNLSRIAQRVYGRANRWRILFDANRDQLDSPDKLEVGMRLKVPVLPGEKE